MAEDGDTGKCDPTSEVPAPTAHVPVTAMRWPRNRVIHRVHPAEYQAAEFNPGLRGNARFSPIQDGQEKPIPTLYGGESFGCAAMETVFHDVPYTVGLKSYDKRKLSGQAYSTIRPLQALLLADLSSTALRKMGLRRSQLIDTEKDAYCATRRWAAAIHAQHRDIQRLCWVSRQDDRTRALMLFGDRLPARILRAVGDSLSLTADETTWLNLLALSERIGVNIVAGKE